MPLSSSFALALNMALPGMGRRKEGPWNAFEQHGLGASFSPIIKIIITQMANGDIPTLFH